MIDLEIDIGDVVSVGGGGRKKPPAGGKYAEPGIAAFNPKPFLLAIGLAVVSRIIERVETGTGPDGEPYSYLPGYRKHKAASGRNPPEASWLNWTGTMLRSLTVVWSDATKAVVGFIGRRNAEIAHKLHYGRFPFMALSKRDADEAVKAGIEQAKQQGWF